MCHSAFRQWRFFVSVRQRSRLVLLRLCLSRSSCMTRSCLLLWSHNASYVSESAPAVREDVLDGCCATGPDVAAGGSELSIAAPPPLLPVREPGTPPSDGAGTGLATKARRVTFAPSPIVFGARARRAVASASVALSPNTASSAAQHVARDPTPRGLSTLKRASSVVLVVPSSVAVPVGTEARDGPRASPRTAPTVGLGSPPAAPAVPVPALSTASLPPSPLLVESRGAGAGLGTPRLLSAVQSTVYPPAASGGGGARVGGSPLRPRMPYSGASSAPGGSARALGVSPVVPPGAPSATVTTEGELDGRLMVQPDARQGTGAPEVNASDTGVSATGPAVDRVSGTGNAGSGYVGVPSIKATLEGLIYKARPSSGSNGASPTSAWGGTATRAPDRGEGGPGIAGPGRQGRQGPVPALRRTVSAVTPSTRGRK
jgi:hypothetical protein